MLWYDFMDFGLIALSILVIIMRYHLLPAAIRFLLFYFIFTFIIEVVAEYFILQGKNNLFIYHFSAPAQYAILCFYFVKLFGQDKNKKILFACALSFIAVLSLSFLFNSLTQYYSFASILKNIIISFVVLVYFRKVFISNENMENHVEENVWICTGLFINSLGNFFIEGSMNYLMATDRNITTKLFYMHLALDFLFYIIFICSIIFTRNRSVK